VLPLVGSTIVPPGFRRPASSAALIIASAGRSFDEPPGFINSSLSAKSQGRSPAIFGTRTSGVLPMRSMTESAISMSLSLRRSATRYRFDLVYDRSQAKGYQGGVVDYGTIRLTDSGDGVWELTLTNPPANALSKQMAFELRHAVAQLATDSSVGAVVLSGEGKVFFGGGDLVEFNEGGDQTPANLHEMTSDFHGAISRMSRMNAPVIGAITGTAGGAGMSLTAAMDLVLAGESAKFTMAYTAAGLTPDGTSSFFLSRVIGLRRATEMVLTNRVLSADEALEWGLINQVHPDDEVLAAARALASKLAAGPTNAFGGAKRLLLEGANSALVRQWSAKPSRSLDNPFTQRRSRESPPSSKSGNLASRVRSHFHLIRLPRDGAKDPLF